MNMMKTKSSPGGTKLPRRGKAPDKGDTKSKPAKPTTKASSANPSNNASSGPSWAQPVKSMLSNVNLKGIIPSSSGDKKETPTKKTPSSSPSNNKPSSTVKKVQSPNPKKTTAASSSGTSNKNKNNVTKKKPTTTKPVAKKPATKPAVVKKQPASKPVAKKPAPRPVPNNKLAVGSPKRASTRNLAPNKVGDLFAPDLDVGALYRNADPSKWKYTESTFSGSVTYETIGKSEPVKGKSIKKGIEKFRANPAEYVAMMYQTSIIDWPEKDHEYTYVHREGTKGYKAQGLDPKGWMTILTQEYQHLPQYKDNELPAQYRDKYTDKMKHRGRLCHSKKVQPILPGRGMGVGDTPNLKIIGDVDPSDIRQGSVGDCWLLSAISALAEFDGAVKKLFRKTKGLESMPHAKPNMYTVTLWDLPTWTEVDIVIDERLCANPTEPGQLLASKPSEDGELWVCYLEKALSIHCGGWDEITGGQCAHAWAMMTGCKEQYTIRMNKKTGKYYCMAKFDPSVRKWAQHYNSPHKGGVMWKCPWPKVGGGGGEGEITQEELFMKMVAWDEKNYIVGAGTKGTSDKNLSGGMVDNHAYSVIEAVKDVAGTHIDLLKVRNPWGKGEIEDGEFDDDGPGWDKYPQVKKALNPVVADDGIFWLTKDEFYKVFDHIYVSASDMTEFLED